MTHHPPDHQEPQMTAPMWLRLNGLTPREAEATLLAISGLRQREVATRMGISLGTVKTFLARARDKLECRSTHDVTALLLRENVIQSRDLRTRGPVHVGENRTSGRPE